MGDVMTIVHRVPRALAWLCLGLCACPAPGGGGGATDTGSSGTGGGTTATATTGATGEAPTTSGGSTGSGAPTTGPTEEPDPNRLLHYFGEVPLLPFEDNVERCASWRLNNDAPLYVQAVELFNEGSYHHSNWIVVPEDEYDGADGFWNCADRGFEEIGATMKGTVLFAQSTQSYHEEQRLAEGAVVKIPPRHKVVGLLHTLNLSPLESESGLWMALHLIHPKDVVGVVTPMSMQYKALDIPALAESRFTGKCDLAVPYGIITLGQPLALRLHYILPHYHYLGNYFDVKVIGGLLDGQSVYNLEGFNGEGNGKTFDPPLDLPGATGLAFTCGYDNWRNEPVQWGNGDGEMCVMLALVETGAVMGASVDTFNGVVDVKDGIQYFEGLCLAAGVPKNDNQGPPTEAEKNGPMYLPPVDPADQNPPPLPSCKDADPAVPPAEPATLTSLRETLFTPACTFSACHGKTAVAGLDLLAADLHAELMNHQVVGNAGMPLVTPGDPDKSWLYQVLSKCTPLDKDGNPRSHMPLNAPFLMNEAVIAKVRGWIESGALDN